MIDLNLNPTRKELRGFAILEVLFFAIVATTAYRHGASKSTAMAIVGVAAAIGAVGFIWPAFMRWVYVAWMIAVYPIGWVVSYLILTTVFFLVITPVGLVMRLAGRDPMRRRFESAVKTYWISRTPQQTTQRYFRQF